MTRARHTGGVASITIAATIAATLVVIGGPVARADADVADPVAQPTRSLLPPTEREEAAQVQVERARALYERGDYGGASAAYRAAYRLRPSPGVMFNLGQSYRLDGRCAEAAGAYRAVLASDLTGPARELAAQQLDAVEICVHAFDLSAVRSARTLRRDGVIAMTAGGAALLLASGLALADDGPHQADDSSSIAIGLAVGGGAALATGAVMFAVAQRRLHRHQARVRPQLGVWRLPIGDHRVAGVAWQF